MHKQQECNEQSLAALVPAAATRPVSEDAWLPAVTVIVPVHNASPFLGECLSSILAQNYRGPLELSVHDDASSDGSLEFIEDWLRRSAEEREARSPFPLTAIVSSNNGAKARGAGAARNVAVRQSSGEVLVLLDSDDVMLEHRVALQVETLRRTEGAGAKDEGELCGSVLVGSNFVRLPADATEHYTKWANSLDERSMLSQQYRECTLIQPTWCLRKSRFEALGGYEEALAEDLRFILRHLELGGRLAKVPEPLVIYRHSGASVCSSTPRQLLLEVRVRSFERRVLSEGSWQDGFTIWGAGRDGKAVFNCLSPEFRDRVRCFCDVDERKIGRPYVNGKAAFAGEDKSKRRAVPVVHWSEAEKPMVLCRSMGRTSGEFEENVRTWAERQSALEMRDYWHLI